MKRMRIIITFLSLILFVGLMSYDAGASPPDYDQNGYYEVPNIDIDTYDFVIEDPQTINVATIDIYQGLYQIIVDNIQEYQSDGKVQNSQSHYNIYKDTGLHSRSRTLTIYKYINRSDLNTTSKTQGQFRYNCPLQTHNTHSNLSYELLGYSMKY